MYDYTECRARLFNAPLLITPAKARVLAEVLATRASWGHAVQFVDMSDPATLAAIAGVDGPRAGLADAARPMDKLFAEADGVAVIRVRGTLVQRNGLDPFSGMTGYDGMARKLDAALNDPSIDAIVLDLDTPGGEVAGCFDLCDQVYAARAVKPVWAILNEMAASAGYALASQCDRVIVPRTGVAGSVGVVTMHVDWSRALDRDGIKVTLIHAGDRKVDGNPFHPLPDDVRENVQAEVEAIRVLFAETVARGRDMSVADVLATEAKTYSGAEAVSIGFADAVLSPEEGFQALLEALAGAPVAIPG